MASYKKYSNGDGAFAEICTDQLSQTMMTESQSKSNANVIEVH